MTGHGFILFVIMILGLWSIAGGTLKAMEGMEAKSWPVAEGRVVRSGLEELYPPRKIGFCGQCFRIEYLYLVGERVLEGRRVGVGWPCFASEGRMKTLSARYPAGKTVEVHYDPGHPERSLLEPGLDWTVFSQWGIGIMAVSAAFPLFRRRG